MSLLDKFKTFIGADDTEAGSAPAWIERLQVAKYISPQGQEVFFDYGDLSAKFNKRVTVFENATAPGAYIQDNGPGAHVFPVVLYFSGDDHDKQSKACISALLETGSASLYHPIFGLIEVVSGGEIQYVSNLVSQANQTTILLEFLEDTGLQISGQSSYNQILDTFNDASAVSFVNNINITDPVDESNFKSSFSRGIGIVSNTLRATSTGLTNSQNKMDDLEDSLQRGIDLLIGQPLAIARQTQILINTPSTVRENLKAKVEAYQNLARNIFGIEATKTGYDYEGENNFYLNNLISAGAVASASTSATLTDFETKKEYLDEALKLQSLIKDFIDWSDQSFTTIDPLADTGNGFQELLNVVNSASGILINSSFNAKTAFTKILDSDRGCQELCFELYGSSKPEILDHFATTNNLGGDELFIIKEGREIVYYL